MLVPPPSPYPRTRTDVRTSRGTSLAWGPRFEHREAPSLRAPRLAPESGLGGPLGGTRAWTASGSRQVLCCQHAPTAPPQLKGGIQTLEFDAGIVGREAPIDLPAGGVPLGLPGRHLPLQGRAVRDAAARQRP